MTTPHGPQDVSADLSSTAVAATAQPSNAAVSNVRGAAQQHMEKPSAQDKQKQEAVVAAVGVETAGSVPSQTTAVVPVLALGGLSGRKQKSSLGACCFLFFSEH